MTNNQKLLIEALRSGQYNQNSSLMMCVRTKDGYAYDPYGVACSVYKHSTNKGEWKEDRNRFVFFLPESSGLRFYSAMPPVVREWLGIDAGLVEKISALHSADWSFERIGIYLEGQFNREE